jgi:hypothetical protein
MHRTNEVHELQKENNKHVRKWHIWFFLTPEPTLKKPKEPFFAYAPTRMITLRINKNRNK